PISQSGAVGAAGGLDCLGHSTTVVINSLQLICSGLRRIRGRAMERLAFDDVELTYELSQGGDRIVLVHASPFVSWYMPLVEQLTDFSPLRYRRRLRHSGDGPYRPLTVAEDAATCARLMDHLGWHAAHVVGHSYGAPVALQLAIDAPERVRSVALLEPAARG